MASLELCVHVTHLFQGNSIDDRNVQPAVGYGLKHVVETTFPQVGAFHDVTQVEAGEGLGAWQDPLSNIAIRNAFGFADIDDVP